MSYGGSAAGKDFPTQLAANAATSQTLYTAQVTGLHRVAVYVEPVSASTMGSVTATIGWTSNGIARSWSSSALSLATLAGSNLISQILVCRCDAGTDITCALQVTGNGGSFSATFGVKPPQ